MSTDRELLHKLFNEEAFLLKWNGGAYTVNRPNIDTQFVVPLDVCKELTIGQVVSVESALAQVVVALSLAKTGMPTDGILTNIENNLSQLSHQGR